jgi:hypothetical protein
MSLLRHIFIDSMYVHCERNCLIATHDVAGASSKVQRHLIRSSPLNEFVTPSEKFAVA